MKFSREIVTSSSKQRRWWWRTSLSGKNGWMKCKIIRMRKNRRLSLIVIIVASDNIQKKNIVGFLFFPFIHPFGRPFPYTLITLLSMLWKEVNVLHEKNLLIAVSCSFFFLFGNIIGLRWKFFFSEGHELWR